MHSTQDTSLLICHELRTPLTSIQGALKLLGGQHFGSLSADGQRLLTIAINNAERLIRLANALEIQPTPLLTVLSASRIELLQLENDLHQAVEQEEFYLLYQPIVCLETNQIIGFEALARWWHSTRNEISPEIFIPLAEKTGLIYGLGCSLLEQACQQLRQWQVEFPSIDSLSVSVNVSVLQLLEPQLVEKISQILEQNQIVPSSLKLEITESALIENKHLALETLIELQRVGVQFHIDDFGTGYSSLGRLQELPFDTLKIDRSFIHNKNWIMSEAILMLAQRLNLDVIVEGVETLDDFISLKQLGCQKMQGYFFSKPTDSASASSMLMQQALGSSNFVNKYAYDCSKP
jgi:c-di-GMP phosphodiesterase